MTQPQSTAVISDCGKYRYALTRPSDAPLRPINPPIMFVMLNPSTADAMYDDPTIRRCRGFARLWHRDGIRVANLFAIRSTDPAGIAAAADPRGPDNDEWLRKLASECKDVVCAWGAHQEAKHRQHHVVDILRASGAELWCLGTTKHGSPRHPLYVPSWKTLERYPK